MKQKIIALVTALALLICSPGICSGEDMSEKTALHVLIIPKFEIGEMAGDFPGEAQLFYERYCTGCSEVAISHMPSTAHFYVNPENGVGILLTGSGKTATSLSLMAVLSSDTYDYSDTYLISVGCAGGSVSRCTLGDVILVTAACDYDLGHHMDAHEKAKSDTHVIWFPDDSYADYEYKLLNAKLCEKVYGMIKDCPLRTTEEAKAVMAENFAAFGAKDVFPAVKKGTALSGDNYWHRV